MRFARFVHAGGVSFGVVEGDGSSGLTVAEIDATPFQEVRFTGQRWALPDVRLLAPIFPTKVIGIGRNYADHAAEMGNEVPKEPLIFIKPNTSVIGPNDAIRIPSVTERVEEEAELAVVIGVSGARRVDRAGAQKAIFGYTVGNDVTARDLQRKDPQWTRAKGFDSFCPIGPWIVTDLDVSDVEVRCEVGRDPQNMEVRQIGRTKDMVFDIPSLISYVSHVMTLLPGDIILTGTPAGVSQIVPGDTVSVSVQGIGELRNPVVALD
ncbi:2-hydroxyhepta-2,4-diene-1,7-dioate isomerase [Actinoplanes sp. OR16]|uniref:fumarylacetoacetate hydrolase family protein n=1 Tax=Actinoplanes sp. OR16 TaxID=946334 RepID=UPI000F6C84BC|nr:fumarylacetoacetate hydrolase family protein [Actinoplanes sp. OR16]BBH64434.1 2-hydroxyhepta-2,4-diene-1,7-dioate isomerase [Actinoplanes sp. OR16]